MPRVYKTPGAESDLVDIWIHIRSDSPDAAERLLEYIDQTCGLLAQFPGMGTSREDLAPDLRGFSLGNYLVFYRPYMDGIEVIRVLSQARDIDSTFF